MKLTVTPEDQTTLRNQSKTRKKGKGKGRGKNKATPKKSKEKGDKGNDEPPKKRKRKVIKPPKLKKKKVKWKLLGMLRRRIAPRNPRVKLKMKMGIRCMDVAGAAMLLKGAALARTQILSQEVPVHPKNPLMLTRSTG